MTDKELALGIVDAVEQLLAAAVPGLLLGMYRKGETDSDLAGRFRAADTWLLTEVLDDPIENANYQAARLAIDAALTQIRC